MGLTSVASKTKPLSDSRGPTMPLSFLKSGESGSIVKISCKEETKKHLSNLGFVPGATVRMICGNSTGFVLEVKGSRMALDPKMASKIILSQ
ncbi:MAG: ferrous iron transport protein A [Candidatus Methanomethylophilaceae archaeon]|nr:ferrous iron transport protein A [Candidatus Methanomethylophilaceae archaeon]